MVEGALEQEREDPWIIRLGECSRRTRARAEIAGSMATARGASADVAKLSLV